MDGFREKDHHQVRSYRPIDTLSKRAEIKRGSTDIMLDSKAENFLERVNRVLAANWVAFKISNMIVCCNQYPYGVLRV